MTARDKHLAAVNAAMVALDQLHALVTAAEGKAAQARELTANATDPYIEGGVTAWWYCDRAVDSLKQTRELLVEKGIAALGQYGRGI